MPTIHDLQLCAVGELDAGTLPVVKYSIVVCGGEMVLRRQIGIHLVQVPIDYAIEPELFKLTSRSLVELDEVIEGELTEPDGPISDDRPPILGGYL